MILVFAGMSANLSAAELDIDITGTSLDELMGMTVTSVSKKEQSVQRTAAAIFVLTNEDIRRSGATSIPEALRLVPGVQVSKLQSGQWAVSIRGFQSRAANKLLVMMDGRPVYDPLFAGVFWEAQDVVLEDIDRIEVVRGPGGAIWGANAVNGIINIITKDTRKTTGVLAVVGTGTEEAGFAAYRQGMLLDDNKSVSVYGKFFDRDEGYRTGGAHDDWRSRRAGIRFDNQVSSQDHLTLWGNVYHVVLGDNLQDSSLSFTDLEHTGMNVQWRWDRVVHESNRMVLQGYYDHTEFDAAVLGELRDTAGIDIQQNYQLRPGHEVIWGVGYRFTTDDIRNSAGLAFDPEKRSDDLYSLFVQDDLELIDDLLKLTLGSKFEHNDYTGIEVQPNIRLAWTPRPSVTWWTSVSRAVRTPSRLEHDFVVPGTLVRGTDDMDSEELVAYEIGYRVRPLESVILDITTFVNIYDKLATFESTEFHNKLSGKVYGAEAMAKWQARRDWRFALSYTVTQFDLEAESGSGAGQDAIRRAGAVNTEDGTPHHQVSLRSSVDLSARLELDCGLRYTDNIPALNVPAYLVADIRLGWRVRDGLEISLVAQNLLDNHHPEQTSTTATEVQDSIYGKVTWRF